jgi:hypothetical protein
MIKKFAVTGSAKNFDSKSQYPHISNFLQNLGMIETSIEECEGLIFLNYNHKSYRQYKKLGKDLNNLVLIRLEPIAVYPRQYQHTIKNKFRLVIDPGREMDKDKKPSTFIGWPYQYNLNPTTPVRNGSSLKSVINQSIKDNNFEIDVWNKKHNKIVLIAANKVSPTSHSNYRLRRQIVKLMNSNEIDVYGELWKSSFKKKLLHRLAVGFYSLKSGYVPNICELYGGIFRKYKSTQGVVQNKHLTIQKYKYSLVIENSSDYCSEKLFDALINGSIPIYIGPNNQRILLPDNLYFSSSGSIVEIRKLIESINSEQVNDMLKFMKVYIQSEAFNQTWGFENVYLKISNAIYRFWSSQ